MKKILSKLFLAIVLAVFSTPPYAVFDPVNDDTDLFRNNPNIQSERPNVLIILDNTANWNQAFTNEKSALVSVVNNLDSSFNVGLMLFPETGSPNDSIDGGYVKFGMRQMVSANKSALATIVGGLDITNDKGNNATTGLAMHEAYLYFSGLPSRASYGKVKTDIAGNTTYNPNAASLAGNALPAGATSTTPYNPAIGTACAKNYIIYISNGPANENASARATAQALLTTAMATASSTMASTPTAITSTQFSVAGDQRTNFAVGNIIEASVTTGNVTGTVSAVSYNGTSTTVTVTLNYGSLAGITAVSYAAPTTPSIIAITPTSVAGQQPNWADEYAKFMAHADVSSSLAGTQSVTTYTVEVDPGTTGGGPDMTALLKSMAVNGNGKYFSVTSGGSGQAIIDALNSIFSEIQAVNSVFAASTLPVSVNVRGTNLNQLYIGVFRPDAKDQPRWFGNLKAYQLKKDPTTGTVFTVDSLLNPAINSTTGFITASAQSFWTSSTEVPTNYWAFRSSTQNGIGGSSDAPDGDLVEKGGAAQQVRSLYFAGGPNGTSPNPFRPLYTCTQGSTFPTCAPGSLLSATPFDSSNTDITASNMNLDTRYVSPLTAAVTKAITSLRDTRSVSLDNSFAGVTVTSISVPNATPKTVTLNNSRSVSISSMTNSSVSQSGTCSRSASNTVQVVTSAAHGLANGATIIVNSSTTNFQTSGTTITYVNSTTFTYGVTGLGNPTATACTVYSANTVVNVNAPSHGFTTGQSVTIAGVTTNPATVNGNSVNPFTGSKTITVDDSNNFHYSVSVAPTPILSSATATGSTSTVTATSSSSFTSGTFSAGQSVTIAGASPSGYNGTYTILSSPAPTSTTFAFTTATTQTTAATGTITATQSGTTATATTAISPHPFTTIGGTVSITGASPSGFNVTSTVSAFTASTFDFTVPAGLGTATANPTIIASATTSTTVTATFANHGLSVGDSITISGVTSPTTFNGPWTVTAVPDANTFQFSTGAALASPTGSPRFQRTSNPFAWATITGHGYGSAGATVSNFTVAGATPSGYNGTFTATIVDADTVKYTLSAALGTNTGTAPTATTPSTTALATSPAHGYVAGQAITIAGASPSAFNGAFTIGTVPSVDTFTYTIPSAQTTASGTITVVSSGSSGSELTNTIDWIRGMDNYEDENSNSSLSDTRASIHGDVLHSRPAVVNYNRRQSDTTNADNDVYIFYGGNDGVFRAVKGGFGSSTGDPVPGAEVWGFVAPEFFPNLRRLRLNSPAISSAYKKPYFFDGSIGTYTIDANGDGMLDKTHARASDGTVTTVTDTGDKVWMYLSMRRGGRFIYALDITDPLTPKLLWRKGCPSLDPSLAGACDTGWEEIGQTWSQPTVINQINASGGDPVLIFGAGYDSLVEDIDPSTVSSSTSTQVVSTSNGTVTRSMGRGLYVINARTGDIIWQASGHARVGSSTHPYKVVSGMDYSIASDVAVVVGDPTTYPFRGYVGDTGGQMWRVDFGDADPANWTVWKVASIADQSTTAGRRKFMFPPEVVGATSFDAVIAGTGDRDHPFDTTVTNRVYMFKDKVRTGAPFTGSPATQVQATITEGTGAGAPMLDVTSNCIQDASACTGTAPQAAGGGYTASQNTANALNASTNFGWYLTLASGEKQVGGTVATGAVGSLGGAIQFATNQPSTVTGTAAVCQQVSTGACQANLGNACQYTLNFLDGTAIVDLNSSNTVTTADRAVAYAGGGFLPSPVLVYVALGGTSGTGGTSTSGGVPVGGTIVGDQLKVGAPPAMGGGNDPTGVVCFGASCSQAPGVQLYSRLRKFWYKELD